MIERAARKNIQVRDKGLDDFMPNRKDYRTPKAEYLLQKFEHVVSGTLRLADGNDYGFVSELTEFLSDILKFWMCPVTATPTPISNAVSLTGCFVLVKESLLFHPMLSWVLTVGAYGFSCLYEDGSYFFDQYAGFFKGSIKKKNNGVFHF
ncbi:MAG: hypothetical protein U5R30_21565 [Deltaproteobacteria bacterium]|nr:hypothetical protein [Deltaproteobacteria bacterium]